MEYQNKKFKKQHGFKKQNNRREQEEREYQNEYKDKTRYREKNIKKSERIPYEKLSLKINQEVRKLEDRKYIKPFKRNSNHSIKYIEEHKKYIIDPKTKDYIKKIPLILLAITKLAANNMILFSDIYRMFLEGKLIKGDDAEMIGKLNLIMIGASKVLSKKSFFGKSAFLLQLIELITKHIPEFIDETNRMVSRNLANHFIITSITTNIQKLFSSFEKQQKQLGQQQQQHKHQNKISTIHHQSKKSIKIAMSK